VVGARGFEPPTPWSRTIWIENLNRFCGVAYGPDSRSFLCLNVPKLYRGLAVPGERNNDYHDLATTKDAALAFLVILEKTKRALA